MTRRVPTVAFWIAYGCAFGVVFIVDAPPWVQTAAVIVACLLAAPLCIAVLRDAYRFFEALIRG